MPPTEIWAPVEFDVDAFVAEGIADLERLLGCYAGFDAWLEEHEPPLRPTSPLS